MNMINVDELIQAIREKQEEDKAWHSGEGGLTYSEIINFILNFARRH